MTLAVLFMTTAIFAQNTKSRQMGSDMKARTDVSLDKVQLMESAKGIVRMSDNECGMYLEVSENGRTVKLHPMDLPAAFRVDGKLISFDFTRQDYGSRSGCEIDGVVSLLNVQARRHSTVKE